MVVNLIPTNSSDAKFKYIKKMMMYGAGAFTNINTPTNTIQPILSNTEHDRFQQNYKDYKENKIARANIGESINSKILTHLSRDITDILYDTNLNDDSKAANYLNAVKRYLTYRGKMYPITPVTSTSTNMENE